MLNKFQPESQESESQASESQEHGAMKQNTAPLKGAIASEEVDAMTPLALSQYIDFDSECSSLFGDQEVESAKKFIKGL
ncbi:MAG: hypothetical protein MH252_06565 [Thermosynechococcaceae cyanobacterium MS004]|nr:hypothetical protein [Thermosynechococcaceae cyanobacterium MS004]